MRSKNKSKNELVQAILDVYQPETAKDVQDALKDVFGPMFEAMLQGEMNSHLGYENNDKGEKTTNNRRNGYISKNVKTGMGEMAIDVPRDRDGSFEPQIIPKWTKDISDIDKKVLSMYAKGMSQRDISSTIEDIYGFKISHETISQITDCVLGELNEWQSRPLKKCYPFVFVDCMYVTMRYEYESKESAVYTILGYDVDGIKTYLEFGWIKQNRNIPGCRYLMK